MTAQRFTLCLSVPPVVKDFDLSQPFAGTPYFALPTPIASHDPLFAAFPSPCGFLTTFTGFFPKSIPPSHLPPINYSFKVVFRVFHDFHSVPVKPLICSSWNICTYICKSLQCSGWNIQPIPFPKKPSPPHPIGTRIGQRNKPDAAPIAASRRLPEALCTFWSPPIPCPVPGPTLANW
jgi:hypothetical protein